MTDSTTNIRSLKLSTHEFSDPAIVRAELMALNTVDLEIETEDKSDTYSLTKADSQAINEALGFLCIDRDNPKASLTKEMVVYFASLFNLKCHDMDK